jgi:hypothetical protein
VAPWCDNAGFHHASSKEEHTMGNKIVTEADRKRTPQPKVSEGYSVKREGVGQKASRARGSHTNHKKNPGKRAHQG